MTRICLHGLRMGCVALGLLVVSCAPSTGGPPPLHGQVGPRVKPTPVWLDIDPAAGIPGKDVDDAVALLQALASPQLRVLGVSVVFGNAPMEQGFAIASTLLSRFAPDANLRVHAGAKSAQALGSSTAASVALEQALRAAHEPVTILMLGPATNVATVLSRSPELHQKIKTIVGVAGRRPGQRFTVGSTSKRGFRDFNFELDHHAYSIVLQSGIPVVLAPFELSSQVLIEARDLQAWRKQPETAAQWLAEHSESWLQLWQQRFGVSGFHPFDALAVGVVTQPRSIHCDAMWSTVEWFTNDRHDIARPAEHDGVPTKPYLHVRTKPKAVPLVQAQPSTSAAYGVRYCHHVRPGFVRTLHRKLGHLRAEPVQRSGKPASAQRTPLIGDT